MYVMSQVSVIAIATQLLPWSKKFSNKIPKLIFVTFAIHKIKSNKILMKFMPRIFCIMVWAAIRDGMIQHLKVLMHCHKNITIRWCIAIVTRLEECVQITVLYLFVNHKNAVWPNKTNQKLYYTQLCKPIYWTQNLLIF